MNMKRVFALVLMTLLLCLPTWASAEDCPFRVTGGIRGTDWNWGNGRLEIEKSGLTVSGGAEDVSIFTYLVSDLILEDVSVSCDGVAVYSEQDSGMYDSFKLTFKGTNTLDGMAGIVSEIPLQIQMEEKSSLSINANSEYPIAIIDTGIPVVPNISEITSGPGTIIINGKTVYQYLTVAVTDSPNGSAEGAGTYLCGDTVTLTATPDVGYDFKGWQLNGEIVSTNAAYTFNVTEDIQLHALFEKKQYAIDVAVSSGGSVEGVGTHKHGDTVTLTATSDAGYDFKGWQLNGEIVSTNAAYTFNVTEDIQLHALFEKKQYMIDVAVSSSGSVEGAGTHKHGDTVTLTAVPDAGYAFMGWQLNGEIVSTNTVYTFAAAQGIQLNAVFEKIPEIIPESTHKPTPDPTPESTLEPAPDLPKTGDESSILLWSVLVSISLFAMTILVHRNKEA